MTDSLIFCLGMITGAVELAVTMILVNLWEGKRK